MPPFHTFCFPPSSRPLRSRKTFWYFFRRPRRHPLPKPSTLPKARLNWLRKVRQPHPHHFHLLRVSAVRLGWTGIWRFRHIWSSASRYYIRAHTLLALLSSLLSQVFDAMGKEGGGFSSFMRKTQGILETIPASVAVVAGTGQKGLSSLLSSTPLVIPLSIHPLTHSSILPLLTPPHRTTMHASPRPSSHTASSPTPLCTCTVVVVVVLSNFSAVASLFR